MTEFLAKSFDLILEIGDDVAVLRDVHLHVHHVLTHLQNKTQGCWLRIDTAGSFSHCLLIHSFIYSFINSFRLFLWRLFKSTTAQRRSQNSRDVVSELHAGE